MTLGDGDHDRRPKTELLVVNLLDQAEGGCVGRIHSLEDSHVVHLGGEVSGEF